MRNREIRGDGQGEKNGSMWQVSKRQGRMEVGIEASTGGRSRSKKEKRKQSNTYDWGGIGKIPSARSMT